MDLFTLQTANASSASQEGEGRWYRCYVWGTWDTATLIVQTSPNDSEWTSFNSSDMTFTEAAAPVDIFVAKGEYVRATLSSVGASTEINVTLRELYREMK